MDLGMDVLNSQKRVTLVTVLESSFGRLGDGIKGGSKSK